MTDRLNGVWVAFENDIREDDAESLINAIKRLRGVLSVKTNVVDFNGWIAEERVRRELGEKLLSILAPKETK